MLSYRSSQQAQGVQARVQEPLSSRLRNKPSGMELLELTEKTAALTLERNSSRRMRRLGPEMMYMGRGTTREAVRKKQAALIAMLFNQAKIEADKESDSESDMGTSILDLSNELLIKVFVFVGTKTKEDDIHNRCINEMLSLRLVCRRFRDLIEIHAALLPKYHFKGIRIHKKEFKAVKGTAIVHRYGTGEFEVPCACLRINDIPDFLKYGEIRGHLITDSLVMDNTLILMLLKLNLEHVRSAVFSNIRVDLKDTTLVNKLLCRLTNAEYINFFGKYQEDELHLDMDVLSGYVERGTAWDNRNYTELELRSLAQQYKFKKKIIKERSAVRYRKLKEMGKDFQKKNREDRRREKKRLRRKLQKLRRRNERKNAGQE